MRNLRRAAWLLALAAAGCGLLFPELNGTAPPDGGVPDGGTTDGAPLTGPRITGTICGIADFRDYRTCASGAGANFRVTVEETRDATTADATGAFALPLTQTLASATVAAVDPSGVFAPTVTKIVLTGGVVTGVGLPVISAASLNQAATTAGFALDGSLGEVLAWAIDSTGAPVPGVTASAPAGGVGPLYDGDSPNSFGFASSTGPRGMVGLFNLPAPSVVVKLTAPANAAVIGDQFTLPVRTGALTITTLLLPPK